MAALLSIAMTILQIIGAMLFGIAIGLVVMVLILGPTFLVDRIAFHPLMPERYRLKARPWIMIFGDIAGLAAAWYLVRLVFG